MKIHHVGYLVQNMKEALEMMLRCGGESCGDIIYDEQRKTDIVFVKNGETLIELVAPRKGSEEVGKSLLRLGNIPYHICYECVSLDETIEELANNGCMLIKEPQEAIAINNRKVAFVYSDSIGLFELVEQE